MSLLDGFVAATPTLAHTFHTTVKNFGERPAQMFKVEGVFQSLSYRQFAQIVEEMATGLIALGIKPGDNVCLMARTAADWGWADFSILTSGGVTVCVYPTLTAEELIFIANHSTARYIVAGDAEVLKRVVAALPEIKTVEKVIVLQAGAGAGNEQVIDIDELRELGRNFAANHPGAYEERWQSLT
ncbi:MAG: AMP-binding protein, partial [Methylocystaceae bacterium]